MMAPFNCRPLSHEYMVIEHSMTGHKIVNRAPVGLATIHKQEYYVPSNAAEWSMKLWSLDRKSTSTRFQPMLRALDLTVSYSTN
jgi:hypothetical protein